MSATWPLVSVVVPVFNSEAYITDCLQSIVTQGYENLEVIVVDDGSTDRSADLVRAIGHPVVYVHQPNSGSAVARNRGIEMSRGPMVAFCDSDDLWAPNRLHQQVRFLQEQTEFHAVCGRFVEAPADFRLTADAAPPDRGAPTIDHSMTGWAYLWLLRDSIYHLDTLLVRREALSSVAFNPIYRRGQDFDFLLQLAQATPIAQLDELYAYYRQHDESITRRPHLRNYRAEVIEAAVQRFGRRDQAGNEMSQDELNRLLGESWFSHGYGLFHSKWYRKAHDAFDRSLKFTPRRWAAYRYMLLCRLSWFMDSMPGDVVPR